MARVGIVVVLVAIGAVVLSAQPVLPSRAAGPLAVLMEIQRLRVENAKLRAQLIGRDRALANARYRCAQQTNELQADVDQERINARAQQLLPDLRNVRSWP